MIQPTELRIGNTVKHKTTGSILTVMEIKESTVRVSYTTDKPRTAIIEYNDLEPIPLTDKILLKCGFNFNFNASRWEINDVGLKITDILGKYYGTNFPIKVSFKYLHQLQNLIYAITGNELEINL